MLGHIHRYAYFILKLGVLRIFNALQTEDLFMYQNSFPLDLKVYNSFVVYYKIRKDICGYFLYLSHICTKLVKKEVFPSSYNRNIDHIFH